MKARLFVTAILVDFVEHNTVEVKVQIERVARAPHKMTTCEHRLNPPATAWQVDDRRLNPVMLAGERSGMERTRAHCIAAILMIGALTAARAAPPATNYLEASAGLTPPSLDGGRSEVEMGDVNGDGNLDLVSVGDHGNPNIGTDQHGAIVWFGDGRGGWTAFQYGNFGYGGIALGDLNGDRLVDIAYGIHHNDSGVPLGDQILEAALGDGTGRVWNAWDAGLATNGENYGMFGTDLADVDGDGRLDLGAISFGCCSGVHVYLNQGNGTWVQSFGFMNGNSDQEFVFGDVNNDGWSDLAVSHSFGTVYIGDGRGGFALADANLPPLSATGRSGVALGDVNGDGRDDLAFVNDSGGPEVWARDPAGSWISYKGTLPATGTWESAQLWDMDGDSTVDLAAFGNRKLNLWKGNGAGGWTPLFSSTMPAPGYSQAFRVGGDADHNGYPDIVLISYEGTAFNQRNHLRFFRESTASAALRVRLVHPGPEARLRTGSVCFIDWAAEVPAAASGTARIEYSLSGTAGPWHLIADAVPNSGRYQWNVVDAPGTDALRLRVTVTAGGNSASGVSVAPLHLVPGRDPLQLVFSGRHALAWTDRMNRGFFNVYRGDWQRFATTGEYTQDPVIVPGAARFCGLTTTSLTDEFTPGPGQLAFYFVSGIAGGVEGSLGTRSDGTERASAHPCP